MGHLFTGQCFKCNNYDHKGNECKSVINNFQNRRNVRCYAYGRFRHVANQYRSRGNQINFNKFGQIAKHCRSRNVNRRGPEDKNKNVKSDEKGKTKVEETRYQMKKTWVKNSDDNVVNGSTPNSNAGNSFSN